MVFFTIDEYSAAVVLEQLPSAADYESLEELKTSLEITLNEEPNNIGALIGLAEVHLYLGDYAAEGEQVLIWEEGLDHAQKAVELESQSAEAHYWVASIMGRIGNAQGIFKSLFLVSPML